MNEKENNSLFTERYKPKCIKEMNLYKEILIKVEEWIQCYKERKYPEKKLLLLSGPPGIGKTTLANLLLKDNGFRVMEYNSGDLRSGKVIKDILGNSLAYENVINLLFNRKNPIGIILDEIDTLAYGESSEKGGFKELLDLLKNDSSKKGNLKIKIPIICTFNDTKNKKIKELYKYGIQISLKKPANMDIDKIIDKIIEKEGIEIDMDAKIALRKYGQSDYRRVITILQYLNVKKKDYYNEEDIEEVIKSFEKKNEEITTIEIVNKILYEDMTIEKCLELYLKEQSILSLILYENYYKKIFNSNKSLKEKYNLIENCQECFVQNDIGETNIILTHNYDMYTYCGLNSAVQLNKNMSKIGKVNMTNQLNSAVILNKASNYYSNKKIASYRNLLDYNLKKELVQAYEKNGLLNNNISIKKLKERLEKKIVDNS